MAGRITEWELISRPRGTDHYVYHGVGTLTRVAGMMTTQLNRLYTHGSPQDRTEVEVLRRELSRRIPAFRSGQQRDAWFPTGAGREFCLGRHLPQVYALVDLRPPEEEGQPLAPEAHIKWFTRLSHDGWCHWTYVWETGRFHHNPYIFDGLHGDVPDVELVPLTLTEFRSRLARHDRKTITKAFTWASTPLERCAPELLLDGPLPRPRI